jgi:heterodisulfide reductase subunit D
MSPLFDRFEAAALAMAERCTSCGKCFEVCPIVDVAGLHGQEPATVVGQLKQLSQGAGAPGPDIARWASACNGSAQCLDACPEDINVREWLALANLKIKIGSETEVARRTTASHQFRTMAQAVKLLASMQVGPAERRKILAPADGRPADVVFYYGCNILRSPHLIFNVMDILDAIEVEYEVLGGTANCCGVVQFMAGDAAAYERMASGTVRSFKSMGAKKVVSWCPTCQIQFGENYAGSVKLEFDMGHVTTFLEQQLDRIRPRIVRQMKKRAVLHEHGGMKGVVEGTKRLLAAIPGLELVEVPQLRDFGYQCSRVAPYPEKQEEVHRTIAESAHAAGVDMIVTIYHGCHRQLAGAEARYGYAVKNFTDVLAEALGRGRTDHYKAYKKVGDIAEAIDAAQVFLQQNGVTLNPEMVQLLKKEIYCEPGINSVRLEPNESLSYST